MTKKDQQEFETKNAEKPQKKTRGAPTNVDKHVGKRLKIRRNLMGMSQDDLAREIGVTFQQIQKYEHGTNRISAGKLFEFAEVMNVMVDFFFEGLPGYDAGMTNAISDNAQTQFGDAEKNTHLNHALDNKETIDLVRAYYAIEDEKVRHRLLQFIKSVAESSQNEGPVSF
ncbi:MAG: transcriptional regulator [Micavibrio sp.]|nr:transcriptional regulator [Micavibrio sp.]HCK32488.1 transcriptional regulator [Rhodospirillaceae bacterium]|tara:strand:+ start:1376 stop:1885 length:510 start_codon:yes stop_codon:yes gene_type:complete